MQCCYVLPKQHRQCRKPGKFNVNGQLYCNCHVPDERKIKPFQRKPENKFSGNDVNLKDEKTCQCCYSDFEPGEEKITCGNHNFCLICFQAYITDKISKDNLDFKCLNDEKCKGHFSEDAFKKLDKKVYVALEELRSRTAILNSGLENFMLCPCCQKFGLTVDNGILPHNMFDCPGCKTISCYNCKKAFHFGEPCKETRSLANIVEEILTKHKIRKCNKCHKAFERFSGCSKMTCVCKTLQCYICRQTIKDYTHFAKEGEAGCKLWATEQDVMNMSLDKAILEIKTTFAGRIEDVFEIIYKLEGVIVIDKLL